MRNSNRFCVIAVAVFFAACRQPANSGGSGGTTAPAAAVQEGKKDATALIAQEKDTADYPEITKIVLDSTKHFFVNDERLESVALSQALTQHWEAFFVEKHTLPRAYHIEYHTEVLMGTEGNVMDEINEAQDSVRQFLQKKYANDGTEFPILNQ